MEAAGTAFTSARSYPRPTATRRAMSARESRCGPPALNTCCMLPLCAAKFSRLRTMATKSCTYTGLRYSSQKKSVASPAERTPSIH